MTRLLSVLICAFVLNSSIAFAVGGTGATCNPSTPSWGSCTLVTPNVTTSNTINVSGGTFASPYPCNQANTKYVLQGDVTANGTAFTISASNVILDLGGHTVTYNQTTAGNGVNCSGVISYVAVVNGSIIQGAAKSSGNQEGQGNNPLNEYYISPNHFHIANLYLEYGGQDVGGIWFSDARNTTIEQCTLTDTYFPGVIANRHQGVDAINLGGTGASGNTVRYCTIINARQRGIRVRSNSEVYQNYVSLRSLDTNSYAIGFWLMHDVDIHDNTIVGKGAHPQGVGLMGQGGSAPQVSNINVYNNLINLEVTMLAREYGDAMFATGVRAGSYESLDVLKNIKIYDNEINITTSSSYSGVWADTGASANLTQRGKGFFVGTYTGGDITIENNTVTFTGNGPAYGVAPHFNEVDTLFVLNNTITTHDCHVVLEDSYSGTHGYPLFMGNHFIKTGSNPSYCTVGGRLNGYFDQTARFVDNVYSGGASAASMCLHPSGPGTVSVYFGTVTGGQYLYTDRYHDNNGASSVLLHDVYNPPISLGYAVPGGQLSPAPIPPPLNLRRIQP